MATATGNSMLMATSIPWIVQKRTLNWYVQDARTVVPMAPAQRPLQYWEDKMRGKCQHKIHSYAVLIRRHKEMFNSSRGKKSLCQLLGSMNRRDVMSQGIGIKKKYKRIKKKIKKDQKENKKGSKKK